MKRSTFVKLSSALIAGHALPPLEAWTPDGRLKNWAGNIVYSTDNVYYPESVAAVQAFVKKTDKLKGLGTRHCFNRIADSNHSLLSLQAMNKVVALDEHAGTVTVEGGIRYGDLSPYLHKRGYALHNLASLPHISIAGSCTTATHGSGSGNGNLATAVKALEIVTADGKVHEFSGETYGEQFNGIVVGLGAFGIITKVTLAIQPTYHIQQNVFVQLPMIQLQEHFTEIVTAGYSVSLFTDWQTDNINEVWIKSRVDHVRHYDQKAVFYGAEAATKDLHPIANLSAENCTTQMGVPGPWYERLPHFKMGFTPSNGAELQSEYFVSRHDAVAAILAVARLGKLIGPHLFISEIRTIDADNLWMSPCRHQASVAIHFTWKQDWPVVSRLLPLIEKELAPFDARPHWGKLFTMSPEVLASRYEKLGDFKKLVAEYDPHGKFRNEFLEKNIYNG